MKNHLSMEESIFSGGSSWWGGSWGSWSEPTRLGEWATEVLVLTIVSKEFRREEYQDLQRDATRGNLAGDQALPSLSALADNVHGVAIKVSN